MAYENLALKYRPQVFSDLVGQDAFSRTVKNAVESQRVAGAFLFYGPRGCGKTSSARILAKTLNCHKLKDHNPCGECPSCLEISQSRSLDVLEIDAASHTQVQNVRDVIIDNINIAPSRDRYKIYILDEVHMLSNSAFNALLKTIEEPPAHAVFIMATTEINKVPATIISRCQTFRFKPISRQALSQRLAEICKKENFSFEERALDLIAASCGGAMRDALTILDRIASFTKGRIETALAMETLGLPPGELIEKLAFSVLKRDATGINEVFKTVSSEGFETTALLRELRNYFAEAFLSASNFSASYKLNPEIMAGRNPYIFAKLSRKMNRIIDEVKFSDNPLIAAEMALYTVIETPVDIEALVKRLENAEAAFSGNYTATPSFSSPVKAEASPAPVNVQKSSAPETARLHPSQAWQKAMESISSQDPALANFLSDCSLVFGENEWKLRFDKEFPLVFCSKKSEYLSSLLSRIYGVQIKLSFELKKKSDEIVEVSNPQQQTERSAQEIENPETAEEKVWKDVSEGDSRDIFPEYKKINKLLKGRVTKVHKIKNSEKGK
ncbi:MAG: DNA polymerase III subunit gamma/tau [Elusimicrobiota bacterium]